MSSSGELVSVALIREDLRQLLVAAEVHQKDRVAGGRDRNARLDVSIQRVSGTANSAEWQPKSADD
jgi:hypothetical protein